MMDEEKQNLSEQEELAQAGMDTFFADAPAAQAKQEKSGGMSKNVKALIASVSVLVLLGGGLAAAMTATMLHDKGNGDGDSSGSVQNTTEATEMISLNESLAEDVTKVEISAKEDFTVYRSAEAAEDAEAVYSIKGMEDIPMNKNLLSTVVRNASALSANSLVEEDAKDLGKYGLAQPAADVTMHYADGASFQIAIGDESPLDNTATYCAVDGDVYLVKSTLMSNYCTEPSFFVTNTILEEPDEADYPIIESVRIQREDLDYDIYLEYADDGESSGGTVAAHVMREPVFVYLSPEKSTDVTHGMFGLTALENTAVHPTDSQLQQAGILEPFCTVEMACDDGNTYQLYLGNTYTSASGTKCYYAYLEGVDVLYGVSETSAVWATMQPGDITSANIFGTMVWDIATLDVTVGDKKLKFEGEGDKDEYHVTKNGTSCDKERFRLFYRFILSIYGEELCLGEEIPDAAPDASIHVVTQDGEEDYTVKFYRLDHLNMMVTMNDEPVYRIRSSCLDTLAHNMEIFDTEEEFTLTWR